MPCTNTIIKWREKKHIVELVRKCNREIVEIPMPLTHISMVYLKKSVFKDQEAAKCLSSLHDKYVIVPADKASNNIVFVCKSYYYECLIKELGINSNTSSNTTYKPTSFDKDEIL